MIEARTALRLSCRAAPLVVVTVMVALAGAGCLDHELEPGTVDAADGGSDTSTTASSVFIAQQNDFGDYEDWMKFETELHGEHGGVIGTVTEYLKSVPAAGSEAFPIGTMIVKTVQPEQGEAPAIHAMVKRGGTFNKLGAFAWEFFELKINQKGVPIIMWRGAQPPTGEQYQALLRQNNDDSMRMEVDCNDCHVVSDNDAVLNDALDLTKLP